MYHFKLLYQSYLRQTKGEPKRKSLTSSFTQMFKRPSGSLGLSSLTSSISQPSSISEDQLQVVGSGYR